jgi:photosynthetic reaction center cytochrome c subunit
MSVRHAAPLLAAFLVVLGARGADAPAPAAPDPVDPSKAEGRFKNIQVFKGYPADDLVPAMQFITAALGVDCAFCHVDHEPEKDDKKHKLTARKMIAMNRAINHDNFDGEAEVTCMSCHRGSTRPVAIPVVAAGEPAPEAAAPKAAELPAASSVLDKYAQAVGGAAALAKVESRVQKGKLTGFGPEPVPVEVTTKAPDKRITIVHGQRGNNVTAFDGTNGWLGSSGRPPRDMSPAEAAATRLDATMLFPSDLKQLFKEFKVASIETIDGKDAVRVIATSEGTTPPASLWFDAQSGLVVRLVRYSATPLGLNPTQIDYADFRAADGVTVPYRWTVARPSGRFTIQVDESKQNVPVDDKTFEKASQAPPS